jgi:hypothetical protein
MYVSPIPVHPTDKMAVAPSPEKLFLFPDSLLSCVVLCFDHLNISFNTPLISVTEMYHPDSQITASSGHHSLVWVRISYTSNYHLYI